MIFWIDDAAKTFILSDGRRLRISRFDKSWISASSDDIQYEFNRTDRTLTYAGSTTKDNVTTTIVGSGRAGACREMGCRDLRAQEDGH